ncbi:MAG: hypothetical protein DRJ63_02910 [Thermoprotei archaeon]|nr:MAG: hypothetical protein DRJ63_02910 [Thermoprotei archaeon]
MSRHINKILISALVAALLIAPLIAYIPTVKASPTQWKGLKLRLVDQLGNPLRCREVLLILWNMSAANETECLLLFTRVQTDCDGYIEVPLNLPISDTSSGLYNFTILLVEEIGGKTYYFLLNWTYDSYPMGVPAYKLTAYFNGSGITFPTPWGTEGNGIIVCYHYWNLKFRVLDNCTQLPIYFPDPNTGAVDAAVVKIYFPDAEGTLIFEDSVDSSGYTDYFNISDTIVELEADMCHIKTLYNTTLYKEVYWSWGHILVAKDFIEFVSYLATTANPWWLGWEPTHHGTPVYISDWVFVEYYEPDIYINDLVLTDTFDPPATPPADSDPFTTTNDYIVSSDAREIVFEYDVEIIDVAYTAMINMTLYDACLEPIIEWGTTLIKVALQYEDITVRSAQTMNCTVPLANYGYEYHGSWYFWVPDVETVYGKNYTVEVIVENIGGGVRIPIFVDEIWYPKNCDKIEYSVDIITSLVPVAIKIVDSEPIAQPLVNDQFGGIEVKVVIKGPWGELETTTAAAGDYIGYVILPPSWAWPSPAPVAALWPYGYLIVPYGESSATYEIKVYFKATHGAEFVDVTNPDNSTIVVKFPTTPAEREEQCHKVYTIIAKVYEVKIKLLSLCDEPLSSNDYADAKLEIYTEDDVKVAEVHTIPEDGTIFIPKLPAGTYKLKLYWKCKWLEPVDGKLLNVTDNILEAEVFKFPVRNIAFQLLSWNPIPGKEGFVGTDPTTGLVDGGYLAIEGLNASLVYGCDYIEWARSNCTGWVVFEKVPVGVEVTLQVYTNQTPYTRREGMFDDNILVYEETITIPVEECTYTEQKHVWIYSFYLQAETCTDEVLESFKSADGKWYNVTVIICDTTWQKEPRECTTGPSPACPTCAPTVPAEITVDFRIMNVSYARPYLKRLGLDWTVATDTPEAKFLITSAQWDPAHPHLFVAGARYTIKVFYGGVLVYNYTFLLPRPDKDVTYIFNETYRLVPALIETAEWIDAIDVVYEYDYETTYDWLYHPILTMKGVSVGEYPVIELKTWVIPFRIWTFTKSYAKEWCGLTPDHEPYLVPGLRIKVNFTSVLDNEFTAWPTNYGDLCDDAESTWSSYDTWYTIEETDVDLKGYVTILVPVWLPRYKAQKHYNGISFGNEIDKVEVYAVGGITPGIPDDYEILVNEYYDCDNNKWVTIKDGADVITDPANYFPPWNISKINEECRTVTVLEPYTEEVCEPEGCVEVTKYKEVTYTLCAGPTWCGVDKRVAVACLECFAVQVYGYDVCGEKTPVAHQRVVVKADGLVVAEGTKETTEPIKFEPTTETVSTPWGTVKKIVEGATLPVWAYTKTAGGFMYTIEVRHDIAAMLKEKGLPTELADKFCLEAYLGLSLEFENKHNCGAEPIEFTWKAILIDLRDIGNKKELPSMTVFAIRMGTNAPAIFDITNEDGKAVLLVDNSTYIIEVYWKDSWFLYYTGKIPNSIRIYNSFIHGGWVVDMSTVNVTTVSIEAYVYILRLNLYKADGKTPLTGAVVEVTWPDTAVTKHEAKEKSYVEVLENKDTRVSVPGTFTLESAVSQCPIGRYLIVVKYKGIEVARQIVDVEAGLEGYPYKEVDIRCEVYDFTITVVTPWGTPLAGAKVAITIPGTGEITGTLDETGSITVQNVPGGEVTLKVVEWKKVSVDWSTTVNYKSPKVTCEKIGKLVVKTTGARGQPLDATVTIAGVLSATAKGGVLEVELPEGSYDITVEYGGKKITKSATVKGKELTEVPVQIDVFIQLAGWPMTLPEFFGFILLIVFIIIALFLIMHEYSVWRKKRLAKALVKPSK